MPKFLIKLPDGTQTSFFTQDDDVFIGRIPSINDVCINDPSISRQHAHIKKKDGGYSVYDLKSLNGLFINGKKVSKGVLGHKDVLRLGNIDIEVWLDDESKKDMSDDIDQYEQTQLHNKIE